MANDIGRQVRDRRLQLGYTSQAQAALAAGIGQDTWGQLERGKLPKTPVVRGKIARALGWPRNALDIIEAGARPADDPRSPDAALLRQFAELQGEVRAIERGYEAVVRRLDEMQSLVELLVPPR